MMIREPFAMGTSVIHRIDPRHKIMAAAAFSFIVAVSVEFSTLLVAIAFSVLLVGMARLDLRAVAGRVLVVLGFILLIWVVLPLTFEGEVMGRIGPLTFMRPGVILAGQITLKSIAISLTFISLVGTMPVTTMGYALNRLRLPDKIVCLLLITYRYFFVIAQEYERLVRATKIRGFHPRTNIHTYKTYAYLIGMLFVRASSRADRVQRAMLCRGFKGIFYTLHEFPPHRRNLIFSAAITVFVFGLVWLEWGILFTIN